MAASRTICLRLWVLVIKTALAQKPRYYPWGCTAPSRETCKYANIADASFETWANSKGQISGHIKHDWCYNDGFPTTAPVGSFPAGKSQFGVLDMAGNVGEWCLDEGQSSDEHVNKGGTWGDAAMYDPAFQSGGDTHFISTWLKVADPGADDRTGFRVACTCDGVGTCQTESQVLTTELIEIPAGNFTAGYGLTANVPKDSPSQTTISSAFWIGKYEVTKGEFRSFVTNASYTPDMSKGANISGDACFVKEANAGWSSNSSKTWDTAISGQTDSHPVSCVTWNDAKKFTEWLTTTNGKGWTCTLPTAAQWEYAARGTSTPCTSDNPDNYNSITNSSNCSSLSVVSNCSSNASSSSSSSSSSSNMSSTSSAVSSTIAPVSTSLSNLSTTAAPTGTTTTGKVGSVTTTTAKSASTENYKVKGTLTFDVASKAQCVSLSNSATFLTTMKSKVISLMGTGSVANTVVSMVCPTRRRLAETRRLAATSKIEYAVSGLTAAAASTASTTISGKSTAALKTAIQQAVASDPNLNVTISNMQRTAATSENTTFASFAAAASMTLVMILVSAVSLVR